MEIQHIQPSTAAAPRLYTGQWSHLFGPGRAETTCRIVVDAANDVLVAAMEFDGLKWVPLSRAAHNDLADSLFDANDVSAQPENAGLAPVLVAPEWAQPSPKAAERRGEVPKPLLELAKRGGLEIEDGAILYSASNGEMVLDRWLMYVDDGLRVQVRLLKPAAGELESVMESPLSEPLSFAQASSMLVAWCVERDLTLTHQRRVADDECQRSAISQSAG